MTPTVTEKWGLGMAPPKPATQRERTAACRRVMMLLNASEMPKANEQILEQLSVVKGMFNRIAREDQWGLVYRIGAVRISFAFSL